MRVCPQCSAEYGDEIGFCTVDGTSLSVLDTADAGLSSDGAEVDLRVGTVLGSYRLLELLGEGGMGRVYLAEHTRLARRVALKLLLPEHASNADVVKRFFGEARAVNQINHENIIEVSDFIEGDDNYFIMELLEGHDLGEVQQREGLLPLSRGVAIGLQISGALAAAHDAGIIHRDLKPENIFLTKRAGRSDFVKVLDFGVAKLMAPKAGQSLAKTGAGAILGTPEYMSPEQVSGRAVDHRCDIYALGVILYEVVTGRKPLRGDSFGELVIQHLTVNPMKPSKVKGLSHRVPARLDTLIMRCLAKEPGRRPQTMRVVESELSSIAESGDLDLAPPLWRRIRPWAMAATLLLVAGAAAAMAYDTLLGEAASNFQSPAAGSAEVVEIAFESSPPGARVFRRGGSEPLGVTPFAIEQARSPEPHLYDFRLQGYQEAERRVPLTADLRVSVKLAKPIKKPVRKTVRKPGGKTPRRKKDAGRRRATIDPFANP